MDPVLTLTKRLYGRHDSQSAMATVIACAQCHQPVAELALQNHNNFLE